MGNVDILGADNLTALLEIARFDFIKTPGGIKARRSIYSIYNIYSDTRLIFQTCFFGLI